MCTLLASQISEDFSLKSGLKRCFFKYQIGISGYAETRIRSDELLGALYVCFSPFKTSISVV